MPNNDLDILVLIRETSDPRPPARVTARGAAINERGLRRVPNPADIIALEEALCLKGTSGAVVTALVIGPDRRDDTARLALSMGADRAIRFWDHGMEGADATADARVVARILSVLSPAFLFTGNRLTDRGDDPVPALAAASQGIPCISAAVSLKLGKAGVEVVRKTDRGGRQAVITPLPCTVLFDEGRAARYPSVDAVTAALGAPVEHWDLARLGIPFWEIGASGAYLMTVDFGVPRPDPVRVATPDPGLPAFERILSLLSGGIKAREGRTHMLPPEHAADELWRILTEEGLVPEAPHPS